MAWASLSLNFSGLYFSFKLDKILIFIKEFGGEEPLGNFCIFYALCISHRDFHYVKFKVKEAYVSPVSETAATFNHYPGHRAVQWRLVFLYILVEIEVYKAY